MHRGNLDLRAVCVYLCVCVFGVLKCISKNQPGARKAEKVIHLLQGVGWGHFGKGFPPFSLSRLPTFPPLTGSVVKKKKKNPPANAGDTGSMPGLERSPRGGNGNPFQYSCLGNPMDRGAWRHTVHVVAKNQT